MTAAAVNPELTVVTTVDAQRERGEIALRSFLAQDALDRIEILVLDRGYRAHPPLASADHPNVRVIPLDARSGYGESLAAGVFEAKSPVVAFVEEHVQVFPDWAAALIEAHKGPWVAVCAEMHPGDLDRPEAVRTELLSRNSWSAPARRGEGLVLRWQNVSYKREALLRYRDRLDLFLQSEGALFRQLRRDGGRLYVEPDAKLVHAHEISWGVFLDGTWHSNRVGAASAAKLSGGGWEGFWKPLAGALLGPVRWPLVVYRRTQDLPDAERWKGVFWRELPYVFQYFLYAAGGTLAGVLFGVGESASRFLDFEINEDRLIPDLKNFRTGSEDGR